MPLKAMRRAREDDIAWLVSQEQRPDFAAFIHRWPADRHLGNLADPDKLYLIGEDEAGERIAFVILAGVAGALRDIELVRMSVAQPGAGVGKLLLVSVLDMAFNTLGAERLWLDVFEDNLRARRAYASAGFREDNTPRQMVRKSDGTSGTLVIMSIRATEYRAP